MKRIVKEYDERLGELLDVSEKLFYSKGFENTSVQEIIDTAKIAKGTFYYYFDSKENLLDRIVKRAVAVSYAETESIVNDQTMNAKEKMQRLLLQIGNQNVEHAESFFHHAQLLDRNLLLREKMYEDTEKMTAPLLARIIEQGGREGIFAVRHPLAVAEMILHMSLFIKEYTAHLMLHPFDGEFPLDSIRVRMEAFADGIGRLLGMREGQERIVDIEEIVGRLRQFERLVEDHDRQGKALQLS